MTRLFELARYPIEAETDERPFLAVWLAFAVAAVVPVLPLLPVVGYLPKALAASERGERLPAVLGDGRTLLRRAVGGSALCVLFLGPPLIALLVTIYGVLFSSGGDVPQIRFLAGSTAVLLSGVVALYLLPIALTAYGREDSLRDALSPGRFREVGGHGAYFYRWTTGAVVLSLAGSAGGILGIVPGIGPVLTGAALAYGLLIAVYYWGRAVGGTR